MAEEGERVQVSVQAEAALAECPEVVARELVGLVPAVAEAAGRGQLPKVAVFGRAAEVVQEAPAAV